MLTDRFVKAVRYANRAHHRQLRKGTAVPYVSHLLGVAALVIDDGGSEDEAIAALLHDVVEDQGGLRRLADVRRRFGAHVAAIVRGCTDATTKPKPPWRARKEEYIRHLRTATDDILRVAAADKLYNARAVLADYRDLGDRVWGRFDGRKNGTLWYYRTLASVLADALPGRLTAELSRVVRTLVRTAR